MRGQPSEGNNTTTQACVAPISFAALTNACRALAVCLTSGGRAAWNKPRPYCVPADQPRPNRSLCSRCCDGPFRAGHRLVPYLSFEPGQTKAFDIILPVP